MNVARRVSLIEDIKKYVKFYWGFLEGRGHLEDLNANYRIILKRTLLITMMKLRDVIRMV
jgi:hypothetical protein